MSKDSKMSDRIPTAMSAKTGMLSAGSRATTVATEPDQVDPQLIMCQICERELSKPKHFPCLHTYCESCLTRYAEKEKEKDSSAQIRCPACSVAVPNSLDADVPSVISRMPTNNLLHSHVIAKQLRTRRCKPCLRLNKTTQATHWCSECQEAMCTNCVETHGSIQLSNRHHVSDIGELDTNGDLVSKKLKCAEHPKEDVVRFCMEHQQACCSRCKASAHAQCTSFLPLERAVEVMRRKQELPVLISQLDTMTSNTKKIVHERRNTLTALEGQKAAQQKKIKELRMKVNKHLDDLERSVHEDFLQKHQMEAQQIAQDIEVFEQKSRTIDYYKQLLDSSSKNVPSVTVLTEGAKIRQQCQILEESLQHRAGKLVRPEYDLKESDLIGDMLTMGTVEVKRVAMNSNKQVKALTSHHSNVAKVVVDKRNNFLALKYQSSYLTGGTMYRNNIMLVDHKGREVRGYSDAGHRQDTQVCVIYGNPWDCAVLPPRKGKDIIAVTIPTMKIIQFLELSKTQMTILDRMGQYTTQDRCYGITHLNGNVLIACMKSIEVWELDPDHRLVYNNTIKTQGDKVKYLCAAGENRLYYSNSDYKGSLFCVTADNSMIFRYSHRNLRVPMGIAVDAKGNVFVAGNHSNNIHQVTPEGALIQIIVPDDEGFRKPILMISDFDKLYVSYENHAVTHLYPSMTSPRPEEPQPARTIPTNDVAALKAKASKSK